MRPAAIAACALIVLASSAAPLAAPPGPMPHAASGEGFRDGLRAFNQRDYGGAYEIWWPLADRDGDAKAQAGLGYLYYSGRGVARDSGRAAAWFYRAAKQGEPTAQFLLAMMHLSGDGVARDRTLSLMWCELAMAGGQAGAYRLREVIMSEMTTEERQTAWDLVAAWYRVYRGAEGE